MVRVNAASRQRLNYADNLKLLNRNWLNFVLVACIGTSICLYMLLWRAEERQAAALYNQTTNKLQQQQRQALQKEQQLHSKLETDEELEEEQADDAQAQLEAQLENEGDDGNQIVDEDDQLPELVAPEDHEEEADPAESRDTMKSIILTAAEVLSGHKPFLVYGTAWKKEMTATHVQEAVKAGFRFIDTACQPKHYNEPGVGQGWKAAAQELQLQRTDLFLQTKFTSLSGQDPNNIPYHKDATLEEQVRQSLQISLQNLQTDYLDSCVMHSPERTLEGTMRVWRVMEEAVDSGKVHRLGISNCYDYGTFTSLYEQARVKPSVLQNRLYEESGFDTELRAFCQEHGIWYQSFWTLTANRHALATPRARQMADSVQGDSKLTPQTLMYAYLMKSGYITPLSGTTSVAHMKEDVDVMVRVQNGEPLFSDESMMHEFGKLLGMEK
jgi:diketogulonate reductase-like aldo/keto reductase